MLCWVIVLWYIFVFIVGVISFGVLLGIVRVMFVMMLLVKLYVRWVIVLVEVGVMINKFVCFVNLIWLMIFGLCLFIIFKWIGFFDNICRVNGVINFVVVCVIMIWIL